MIAGGAVPGAGGDDAARVSADRPDGIRRGLIAAGGVAMMAATMARSESSEPTLATPPLTPVFRATVLIGAPIELGLIDGVHKRVIPITGGRFGGPRLSGEVLPGGADWQSVRADGSAEIYARYTLQTTDGTVITIENPGVRRGPAAVLARLAAGEEVDPTLYYFRTTPRFTVRDGPHRWLAESVFVANAARYRDHVVVEVFAVG